MKNKYVIKFWFEHGGICLWAKNDAAEDRYGYAIKSDTLPISNDLVNALDKLEDEYATCLNWAEPNNPSLWSNEQKIKFRNDANTLYKRLCDELGEEYEIINDIDGCIYD